MGGAVDGGRLGFPTRAARMCMSAVVLLSALATVRVPEAAAETAPAWSKSRFDAANTAFNPSESWLSTGNVASSALDWSTRINPRETPLVAGGVIYAGCETDAFCALDATNGSVRWKSVVGAPIPSRTSALVGGIVYTAGSSYAQATGSWAPFLVALNAGTGAIVWKTRIMSGCCNGGTTPIVVAEGLVVQGWSRHLLAWDAATGIPRWIAPVWARSAPAIVNGVVYVQADYPSLTVQALRSSTGETLWRSEPAAGDPTAVVVSSGLVVVARDQTSSAARVSAYPAAGCGASVCQPVWSSAGSPAPSASPAVAGGVVYQGLADGSYAAIELTTGHPLWRAATGVAGQPAAGATLANGVLLGQSGGYLYAWAAAGCGVAVCQPLWKTLIAVDPWSSGTWTAGDTVVSSGRVYVVNNLVAHGVVPEAGELRVFSPRQNPPPALTPPPVVPVVSPPMRTVPTTLNVPKDHLSIQRAIQASIPGDVVLVAPGVYHERIDFEGHSVEVRSAGGPEVTTIDGDDMSTVVAFQNKETRASVLRGFTIRNGLASPWGGAIVVGEASPSIIGNVITGNRSYGGGPGITVKGGAPAIVGNQIRDNHSVGDGYQYTGGGGIDIDAGAGAEVRANLIEDNSAGVGGGLSAMSHGPMTITENLIRRNTALAMVGGVLLNGGADVLFAQNVVVDNTLVGPDGVGGVSAGGATLLANTIAGNVSARASGLGGAGAVKGNVITGPPGISVVECGDPFSWTFEGNIIFNGDPQPSVDCADHSLSADPRFVNPGVGDFRLGQGSPAIDAGVASPLLPVTDIAGAPRIVDGNGDGVATIDIGAYEGQLPLPEVVRDGFHALTPARLLDSRAGVGAPARPLGQGGTLDLQVTGRGGVPATGVSSVVLNVTVTETTATSFLTVWPSGVTRPLASNLNYDAGRTVPNMVTVKVGAGGKVSLYNNSGSTHVVADVAGWYGAGDGAPYTSVSPSRILDTRVGVGAPTAVVGPASTLSLKVTGQAGVPESGVSAVVLNLTVTEPTATSFLTAWPAGVARPLASNLNFVAGQTVPNLVLVKVGAGGRINLYNSAGTAHVIADVEGWFGDGADSTFTALPPARILDTRTAAKPGPASVVELQVTGVGGVPATGVSAVVLNVTVTEPTAGSFLTGWPAGEARPLASNLNYVAGLTVPNLVVVKVGDGGKVSLYNYDGRVHVIADVAGWYG
jgi:outer membrane protein assembly factor BamB